MILTVLLMSVLVLLLGAMLAATPWIMPPTECFTVSIPPSAQHDPRIEGYRRSYALTMGICAALCAVGLAIALPRIMGNDPASPQAAFLSSTIITIATLLPIAVGFVLMLFYRARVQALKEAESWTASAQQAASLVAEEVPQPISLAWNLLHAVLTLVMIAFALAMYDRFPARIPMNVDFSGNVSTYANKSVGVVLFPAIVVGFMGIIFTISHYFIIISKHPIDPAAPLSSALAYGRFARIQSQLMLVGGLLLSSAIGGAFYLSSLGIVPMTVTASSLMVVVVLFVSAVAIISVKLGQSGARLAAELRSDDALARDDDSHWYLGTLYFNRDDPSIIVPKRFGIGWTINHARPAAWALIGVIVLVTALFCLLMGQIAG